MNIFEIIGISSVIGFIFVIVFLFGFVLIVVKVFSIQSALETIKNQLLYDAEQRRKNKNL
jgi:hypothetical protein